MPSFGYEVDEEGFPTNKKSDYLRHNWYQNPENFKPDPNEDPRVKYYKYRDM